MNSIEKTTITGSYRKGSVRIGIFGVGYERYWDQFPGLLDELMVKHEAIIGMLPDMGLTVIDFGMIDNAAKAYELVRKAEASGLDMIFCNMLTYATSGTFAILVRSLAIPLVLVALQPLKALDYSRASTYMQLLNDDICSLPEFAGVAARMGKRVPEMIIGSLTDDAESVKKLDEYCRIASVVSGLRNAHFGHLGHPINSMMDMNTDPTMLTASFGCHVTECEANELMAFYRAVIDREIADEEKKILDFFETPDPVSDPISMKLRKEDLHAAAKVSVALRKFIRHTDIDGLSYYYDGPEGSEIRMVMSNLIVGNSLLAAEGIPMCGESDQKTLVALFIMMRLGIGGSFAEFHPVDYNEGFVLVGHDGPHNITIAQGKPVLRSLKKFHGKPGFGASVEFSIREGPVTMLSVNSTFEGKFRFVIAEGESVRGPIPPTGNTNTRGFFKPDVKTFLERWIKEGPTHHFALGTGHHAGSLRKIAEYLGIEAVVISEER